MKLCHIIDIWLSFITQVQKFGGPFLKHLEPKTVCGQLGNRSTGRHISVNGATVPPNIIVTLIIVNSTERTKKSFIFTARCTLVQRGLLRSHVVCPSVRLSVTLVDFDHTGWNSSKIISLLLSEMCSLSAVPNIMDLAQGEHQEILVQIDPPPLI